jgi:hypothetical protein
MSTTSTTTSTAGSSSAEPPTLDARLTAGTVLGAVTLSAFALALAAVRATGGTPPWDESTGAAPAVAAGMVLHSLSYLLFAAVLVAGATQIDGGRRAGRVVRQLLIGAFVVLGAAFAGLTLTSASDVGAPVALEAAAGIGFAAMFLLAFGLGVVLFRQHHTRLPGALLLSIPLLLGLTTAVGVLAPDWAHPAYLETGLYAGTATLALACRRPSSPAPRV